MSLDVPGRPPVHPGVQRLAVGGALRLVPAACRAVLLAMCVVPADSWSSQGSSVPWVLSFYSLRIRQQQSNTLVDTPAHCCPASKGRRTADSK